MSSYLEGRQSLSPESLVALATAFEEHAAELRKEAARNVAG